MKDLAGDDLVKVLDVYHTSLRARAETLSKGAGQDTIGTRAWVALLVVAELIGAACDTIEAIDAMEADS